MGSQRSDIDEQSTQGSTPEDVAALYAWANLSGAKYRDYSASRREHRAQSRYLAAKAQLDRELKAQADAEAAAETAEQEAAAAEARALAGAGDQSQQSRFDALRAAEAAALKAAHDRVEAARRAESATHATVLALREKRELAEAHESAAQQAMIYSEVDALRRQLAGPQPRMTLEKGSALQPETIELTASAEAEAPVADALPDAKKTEPQSMPARPKSGSWMPLSEEILGPDEDWSLRGDASDLAKTDVADTAAQPAWLTVSQSLTEKPEPADDEVQQLEHPAMLQPDTAVAVSEDVAADTAESFVPEVVADAVESQEAGAVLDAAERAAPESAASELHRREPDAPALATPVLAVFSPVAGAGATSLVAAVGGALAAAGEKVVLADMTATAQLPLYFGGKALAEGLMRTYWPANPGEPISILRCVPGQLDQYEAPRERFWGETTSGAPAMERAILDLSGAALKLLPRIATANTVVLIPIAPTMDAANQVETSERLLRYVQDKAGEQQSGFLRGPYYVLSRFEPSSPLHAYVLTKLRGVLGDRLLKVTIRSSSIVGEGFAEGIHVLDHAPESEVAAEYRSLAAWLREVSPLKSSGEAHGSRGTP